MSGTADSETLISHLEELRKRLLRIFAAVALLFPVCFYLSPYVIEQLVRWCCPPEIGPLHYFTPLEVFFVQLKLALILALAASYPWNVLQAWNFLLPALYRKERKALGWWILFSSVLFFGGIAFCVGLILPMLMRFSGSFATPGLQPILGLAGFLSLAGWLMLAFGIMFQAPTVVLILVRLGLVSVDSLRKKRPYVMVAILVIAALLTPPDVVSQVLLAVPTWLLFELSLYLAGRMAPSKEAEGDPDP